MVGLVGLIGLVGLGKLTVQLKVRLKMRGLKGLGLRRLSLEVSERQIK